jgi:hypothetical protein
MNIFRFIADMLHLAAIVTLLYRIKVTRNCIGKSTPSLIILMLSNFCDDVVEQQSLSALRVKTKVEMV